MKRALMVLAGLVLAAGLYLSEQEDGRVLSVPDSPAPQGAPSGPSASSTSERVPPASAPAPELAGDEPWSDTDPAINLAHIFEGEINRRGKPVGYHSRPDGEDPPGARVVRIVEEENDAGVYIADVEIRSRSGRWQGKRSTFYPDKMGRDEVVQAILHAWEDGQRFRDGRFRGDSGHGFTIEGRTLEDGRINTAYPILVRP